MLVVLLLPTQVVKTTPVNTMDQYNYPLEMISTAWGQTVYPISVRRQVHSLQSQNMISNQKNNNGRSGAEEDDLTTDLLQIHSLLHRVMQRKMI